MKIWRNQALRDANLLFKIGNSIIISYGMPNGSYFLNIITDITQPNSYNPVSLAILIPRLDPSQLEILINDFALHAEEMEEKQDRKRKSWDDSIMRTVNHYKTQIEQLTRE